MRQSISENDLRFCHKYYLLNCIFAMFPRREN